ncbi:pep-cterm sorting domain-containing protein [Anaeramoeba ignava]|uniref:Pep-cterm sorting domain-containing protein n=1 Tax=Anaeramoeba ignava TaxID=1746090 RepID=A0A9Q0LRP0_ANAIG|nr:pep-cterm sorting domain-containing protein [Anaeramoeba ignava]
MNQTFSNFQELSQNLFKLFNQQNFLSDFEIEVKNQFKFYCHKSILYSRSPFFKEFFENETTKNQKNFRLNSVKKEAMEKVLIFIYSGTVELNDDTVLDVMLLSNKLRIQRLQEFSQEFFQKKLSIQNILQVYDISLQFNSQLKNKCVKFMNKNMSQILKEGRYSDLSSFSMKEILKSNQFIIKKESELMKFLLKWNEFFEANLTEKNKINENDEKKEKKEDDSKYFFKLEENKENKENKEEKDNFFKYIRFIDFSPDELFEYKEYIPKEVLLDIFSLKTVSSLNQRKIFMNFSSNPLFEGSLIYTPRINFFTKSKILSDERNQKSINYYIFKLSQWLGSTDFLNSCSLCFRATRDDFSAERFHAQCDEQGPTLVFYQTPKNFIYGGFTTAGWKDPIDGYFVTDPNAFIFLINNPESNYPAEKFANTEEEHALFYKKDRGPTFGDSDSTSDSLLTDHFAGFGYSYKNPTSDDFDPLKESTFFAGSDIKNKLMEIEVFCLIDSKKEKLN